MIDITQYFAKGYVAPDIVKNFEMDLRTNPQNMIDIEHSNLLLRYGTYLQSNDFLDNISNDMADFRKEIVSLYPDLTLTVSGRIKSIIRLEEKFNGYIIEYSSKYYLKNKTFPSEKEMIEYLQRFRDLIAYRIIISVPKAKLGKSNKEKLEIDYLYKIANRLPLFFTKRGYTCEQASALVGVIPTHKKSRLSPENRQYFKDYIAQPKEYSGYQSLHISLIDNHSHFSNIEIQLRTFDMDCFAELEENVNHTFYENKQNESRKEAQKEIPSEKCSYYDDAVLRYNLLSSFDLTQANIDHFKAIKKNKTVIYNDHAGVRFGRVIDPREYLALR